MASKPVAKKVVKGVKRQVAAPKKVASAPKKAAVKAAVRRVDPVDVSVPVPVEAEAVVAAVTPTLAEGYEMGPGGPVLKDGWMLTEAGPREDPSKRGFAR